MARCQHVRFATGRYPDLVKISKSVFCYTDFGLYYLYSGIVH